MLLVSRGLLLGGRGRGGGFEWCFCMRDMGRDGVWWLAVFLFRVLQFELDFSSISFPKIVNSISKKPGFSNRLSYNSITKSLPSSILHRSCTKLHHMPNQQKNPTPNNPPLHSPTKPSRLPTSSQKKRKGEEGTALTANRTRGPCNLLQWQARIFCLKISFFDAGGGQGR